MTLVEWLTAILDEDERVARAATEVCPTPWEYVEPAEDAFDSGYVASAGSYDVTVHPDGRIYSNGSVQNDEYGRHIALHDPAAVLADITAKREIIEYCAHFIDIEGHVGSRRAGVCDDVLRALASAYVHRDGFDPSWA